MLLRRVRLFFVLFPRICPKRMKYKKRTRSRKSSPFSFFLHVMHRILSPKQIVDPALQQARPRRQKGNVGITQIPLPFADRLRRNAQQSAKRLLRQRVPTSVVLDLLGDQNSVDSRLHGQIPSACVRRAHPRAHRVVWARSVTTSYQTKTHSSSDVQLMALGAHRIG